MRGQVFRRIRYGRFMSLSEDQADKVFYKRLKSE